MWKIEYLHCFKVPLHKIFTYYKEKNLEKPGKHHFNKTTKINIIRNRTNWNRVPFYNEGPYWLHREDHSIYFCDIPAKDVQPESNHEETSNSN